MFNTEVFGSKSQNSYPANYQGLFSNNNIKNNNNQNTTPTEQRFGVSLFGFKESSSLFSDNNQQNNNNQNTSIFGTNSNSTFLFEINKNNNATSSFLLSEKFKAEYKCQIISNKNKPFSLTIKNLSNFLEINAFYQAIFQKKEYTKKYSFGELKEIRFLSICDTIDEIFEELKFEFSNNSPRIEEDINKINVILPNTHTKFKEITFELFEKIKFGSDIFEELYPLIDDLKKKVENYEKEKKEIIDCCNKKIDEMKNSVFFYCQQINNENKKYEDLIEKNKKLEEKVDYLEKELENLKMKLE